MFFKIFLLFFAFLAFLLNSCFAPSNSNVRIINNNNDLFVSESVLNRALNSVVLLKIQNIELNLRKSCTGFFISPNRIVTAYHCVVFDEEEDAVTIPVEIRYITYHDWASGYFNYKLLQVSRTDSEKDIAILSTMPGDFSLNWLQFRTSPVRIGEKVFVVSQPVYLRWIVTNGIISQIGSIGDYRYIVSNAFVFLGSSGAPLMDYNGNVVGVAHALAFRQGSYGIFVHYIEIIKLLRSS